jgi:hypothetical protein
LQLEGKALELLFVTSSHFPFKGVSQVSLFLQEPAVIIKRDNMENSSFTV